jgi:hypothetical protein
MGGLIPGRLATTTLVKRKVARREQYTRIGHGPVRPMLALHRALPAVHLGLSHPAAQGHADAAYDRRIESARPACGRSTGCECNVCSLIACPEQLDPKNICVDAEAPVRENKLSRTAGRAGRSVPAAAPGPARDAHDPSKRSINGWD